MASEHGLTNVLMQEDSEVLEAYGVEATPGAVLVRPDGTIGSRVFEGVRTVRNFVTSTLEEPAQQSINP
jgi:hypothetical protein